MKFKPFDDRVIVEKKEAFEFKSSLIGIPDSVKEGMKKDIGTVIATSINDEDMQEFFPVGTVVYFGQYSGESIELDGKEYLVVTRADILGILDIDKKEK